MIFFLFPLVAVVSVLFGFFEVLWELIVMLWNLINGSGEHHRREHPLEHLETMYKGARRAKRHGGWTGTGL